MAKFGAFSLLAVALTVANCDNIARKKLRIPTARVISGDISPNRVSNRGVYGNRLSSYIRAERFPYGKLNYKTDINRYINQRWLNSFPLRRVFPTKTDFTGISSRAQRKTRLEKNRRYRNRSSRSITNQRLSAPNEQYSTAKGPITSSLLSNNARQSSSLRKFNENSARLSGKLPENKVRSFIPSEKQIQRVRDKVSGRRGERQQIRNRNVLLLRNVRIHRAIDPKQMTLGSFTNQQMRLYYVGRQKDWNRFGLIRSRRFLDKIQLPVTGVKSKNMKPINSFERTRLGIIGPSFIRSKLTSLSSMRLKPRQHQASSRTESSIRKTTTTNIRQQPTNRFALGTRASGSLVNNWRQKVSSNQVLNVGKNKDSSRSTRRQGWGITRRTKSTRDVSLMRNKRDVSLKRNSRDVSLIRNSRDVSLTINSRVVSPARTSRDFRLTKNSRDVSLMRKSRDVSLTRNSRGVSPARNSRDFRLTKNSRDVSLMRKSRDVSLTKKSRDFRLTRNSRDVSLTRNSRDVSLIRNSRDVSLTRNSRDVSPMRNSRDVSLTRNSRDVRLIRNSRDVSPTRNSRDVSLTRNSRDVSQTRNSRDVSLTRNSRDVSVTRNSRDVSLTRNSRDVSLTRNSRDVSLTSNSRHVSLTRNSRDDRLMRNSRDVRLRRNSRDVRLMRNSRDVLLLKNQSIRRKPIDSRQFSQSKSAADALKRNLVRKVFRNDIASALYSSKRMGRFSLDRTRNGGGNRYVGINKNGLTSRMVEDGRSEGTVEEYAGKYSKSTRRQSFDFSESRQRRVQSRIYDETMQRLTFAHFRNRQKGRRLPVAERRRSIATMYKRQNFRRTTHEPDRHRIEVRSRSDGNTRNWPKRSYNFKRRHSEHSRTTAVSASSLRIQTSRTEKAAFSNTRISGPSNIFTTRKKYQLFDDKLDVQRRGILQKQSRVVRSRKNFRSTSSSVKINRSNRKARLGLSARTRVLKLNRNSYLPKLIRTKRVDHKLGSIRSQSDRFPSNIFVKTGTPIEAKSPISKIKMNVGATKYQQRLLELVSSDNVLKYSQVNCQHKSSCRDNYCFDQNANSSLLSLTSNDGCTSGLQESDLELDGVSAILTTHVISSVQSSLKQWQSQISPQTSCVKAKKFRTPVEESAAGILQVADRLKILSQIFSDETPNDKSQLDSKKFEFNQPTGDYVETNRMEEPAGLSPEGDLWLHLAFACTVVLSTPLTKRLTPQ